MKKLFVVLFLLIESQSFAATYYVDADCSTATGASGLTTYNPTTESCTTGSSRVWNHPQLAASFTSLAAGDTIIVANGTYTDTNGDGKVVNITKTDTAGNVVTFQSKNKWGAVIDATPIASNKSCFAIENAATAYIKIDG